MSGEEALIQTYFAPLAASFPGAYGLLDDCASLAARAGEDLVVTTDAVAANVHFFPDDAAADIAWKALAVNVSDLVAKGAKPVAYVMSLAFPELPQPEWLRGFANGLAAAQAAFGLALAGGDTDRRPGPLAITITAFGAVPSERMVRRATAKAGDLLFVSGTLGDSALGLKLRQRPELAADWGLDAAACASLVARYLRPEPRVTLAGTVSAHASAAMDISDGLAKDLDRMARASGVSGRVQVSAVPVSRAAAAVLRADPSLMEAVLGGGDDYEVLATVSRQRSQAFRAQAAAEGVTVTEIGRIEAGSGTLMLGRDGQWIAIERSGYDHFA